MLLACKYGGRDDALRFLVGRLAELLRSAAWFREVEALVAVPTILRRHWRGQPYLATRLARQLAGVVRLPDLPLLRRVRGGPSQVGLPRTRREENVRGAFRLTPGVRLDKAVLCLVDDVTTSGATLCECARVLRRGGAAKVFAAVICKAGSSQMA